MDRIAVTLSVSPKWKKKNFSSFLGIIFFIIFVVNVKKSNATIECLTLGLWGPWGEWSACPENPPIPLLNIQRRLRDCIPQPSNCTPAHMYGCSGGAYSEIITCVASTTTMKVGLTIPTFLTTTPSTTSTTTITTTTTSVTTTTTIPTTTATIPICGSLWQNATSGTSLTGNLTFSYATNSSGQFANISCTAPSSSSNYNVILVVNGQNVTFSQQSISYPAVCLNGQWSIGTQTLTTFSTLECQAIPQQTTTTTTTSTTTTTTPTTTTTIPVCGQLWQNTTSGGNSAGNLTFSYTTNSSGQFANMVCSAPNSLYDATFVVNGQNLTNSQGSTSMAAICNNGYWTIAPQGGTATSSTSATFSTLECRITLRPTTTTTTTTSTTTTTTPTTTTTIPVCGQLWQNTTSGGNSAGNLTFSYATNSSGQFAYLLCSAPNSLYDATLVVDGQNFSVSQGLTSLPAICNNGHWAIAPQGGTTTASLTSTTFSTLECRITLIPTTTTTTTSTTTTTATPTTTTTTMKPVCGPLWQNTTSGRNSSGILTFTYDSNVVPQVAIFSCSQQSSTTISYVAIIVNGQYVNFGTYSISYSANCINGQWTMTVTSFSTLSPTTGSIITPMIVQTLECVVYPIATTSTTTTPTTTSTTTTTITTTTPPTPTLTTTSLSTVITTTPLTTTSTPTTTTSPSTTTTTLAASTTQITVGAVAPGCEGTQWNTWMAWTDCTDTCGSCGLNQRFRSCNKTITTCKCPGEAFQRQYCNIAVCKYPRVSPCCSGFTPYSQNGQFECVANTTTTGRR